VGVRLFYVLILLVCFVESVHAQQVNPFELYQGTSDTVNVSPGLDTLPAVVDSNLIFDTLYSETASSLPLPTIASKETIIAPEISESPNLIPQHEINPFELSEEINSPIEVKTLPVQETQVPDSTNQIAHNPIEQDQHEQENEYTSLPEKKNTLVFIISLICGLLLSFLLTVNRKILGEIIKSLSNINYMKLFQKEEQNGASVSFIILYIIFILNAAVLLKFAFMEFEIPLFGYNFYKFVIIVTLIVLLRHFSLNVVSYLRKRLPDAINYSFIIAIINGLVGLVLIPINLLIAFGPEIMTRNVIILGLIVMVLAYMIKWFRGFINSARIILGDSFHFLLYLCTCEIVPIFICIAYVRNLIN